MAMAFDWDAQPGPKSTLNEFSVYTYAARGQLNISSTFVNIRVHCGPSPEYHIMTRSGNWQEWIEHDTLDATYN